MNFPVRHALMGVVDSVVDSVVGYAAMGLVMHLLG